VRRRILVLFTLVMVGTAACSNDSGGSAADTTVGSEQTTTTFMPDCTLMPTAADISAVVGVPMADGTVVGSGSCLYLGVNDQSKVVALSVYLSPTDQAAWNDLQASLGTPTPYDDPAAPGALAAPDGTLYVTANGAIYTARVEVSGGTATEQLPAAAQLLARWLAL
jgi:hypothetical protein